MGTINLILLIVAIVAILPILETKKTPFDALGNIASILTPKNEDGTINFSIIPRYAQLLKDKGVDGIMLFGSDGPSLNVDDKMQLLDNWVEVTENLGLSVLVQVGGVPLTDAVELAEYAADVSVDAIVTYPDLIYKPKNTKELVYFLQFIAKAAPTIPLLYYDSPSTTDVFVDILELCLQARNKIDSFQGVNTDVFDNALKLQNEGIEDITIYISDSLYLAPAALVDFSNFILTSINIFPELVIDIVTNGNAFNQKETITQYRRLIELLDDIRLKGVNTLAADKYAVLLVNGIDLGDIEDPVMQLTDEQKSSIAQRLRGDRVKLYD